jgi:hypothetical protein
MDLVTVDGIPATSLARTQLDLAAILPKERLQGAIERAEELGVFDLGKLDGALDLYPGHPGAGRLRETLSSHRPDMTFTRSGLERRFLALIRSAGLPPPSMNFNVAGFEVDAYWEAERFAVELDVFETHGTRAAFERDRLRDEELKLAGVETVRVTGSRLDREPRRVIERVALLLERRRRELRLPAGGAR